MKQQNTAAFTLIELLVVISIIAILAALAVPALTNALTKGQLTGTMNNARQLYLAGFQMATDGAANSDPNYSWPGDGTPPSSLADYCTKLVQNDYLKPGDLQKILNAPGAACTVATTAGASGGSSSVRLSGTSALKVYLVQDVNPSNTIFAATTNFVYNSALNAADVPYGDKGFVIIRKGGDAGTFKRNQATAPTGGSGPAAYQASIGRMPGDTEGTLGSEGSNVLIQKQ
ncbi:MAG TPA: type II secretion system protein [Chthoniobacterales bacterium]|nr:type II secretion system protein [Chthoniobacterales bacterium]